MLRVYLKDGAQLKVDTTLDEFERAIGEAVLIRIKTDDGQTVAISPSNVSLIETLSDNGATPNGHGSVWPLSPAS